MQATVVIPVWNGETVLEDCLTAVFNTPSPHLLDVICVENGSQDGSRQLIATKFPQATLLPQPTNLGFAGGVNVGLRAAAGDLLVLLNQDCIVQPGWLDALCQASEQNPALGIIGGQIRHADGSVNHAGAVLERPLAYGRHLTNAEHPIEYVTGALFGITRRAWETVGEFDEGFFPAYFEEVDYCFRACQAGFEIGYVPAAAAVHLFNNKSWQTDPITHNANQHAMRYRFVAKQYSLAELAPFFAAEINAIQQEIYYEQAIGRLLGLRQLLPSLPGIQAIRAEQLQQKRSADEVRTLTTQFTALLHHALDAALSTSLKRQPDAPSPLDNAWHETWQRLQTLQQQENDLLARIYFVKPSQTASEPGWQRWWRLLVLRPFSFIIGRDYYLLAQLNTIHVARLDQMNKLNRLIERRLLLLETLTRYEHR
jgi:GT2 family glycosyltransferase